MIILHKLVGKKGMFYVEIDGNILAEMVCSMASPIKMIIIPLCPFAKSVFDRKEELRDALE